ncbi:HlyD family type I secretion periplasmic adaptor subunit [Chthonobacter rhizosphaerae]|uniref:HlyD family type I secretion periplasmic adaptor subunit n=1 Tax=Chthonobacter rhizosphaerae TaxID=2735553 RepID=UPI0015EF7141|nr:HlyD family type I secretion periplasmic adaptor subunit [Chthonobacter rhizosphaerae]
MSMLARSHEWYADVPRGTRAPTLFGFGVLLGAGLLFGVWGNSAPIAGAVVAPGVFVTTGQNKTIQHLEGGVISEILVREGDVVEARQILVRLDGTAAGADLRRLILRQARTMAIDARLTAEMLDRDALEIPPALKGSAASDPDVAAIVEAQTLAFEARRATLRSELDAVDDGVAALNERIGGSRIQLAAVRDQLALIKDELGNKEGLLKKGLIRRAEVLALRRAQSALEGDVGRLQGDIGDAHERIARAREQALGLRKAAVKQAVEQLHEVRAELNDLREMIRAAEDVLNRSLILAPSRGVVVKLRYHTPGGVIEPGKPILDIVPLQDDLIIEVKVRPQDIDTVRRNQEAFVRLTALSQRITPIVEGRVVYVSADALPDERRGASQVPDSYVARIRLDAAMAKHVAGFEPTPGMPAEVYIKTEDRTFFEYLMRPIKDSMSRAFRET